MIQEFRSYQDMKVEIIWASPNPGAQIREALDNTMKNISILASDKDNQVSAKTLKFLFQAEHSSTVEHAVISFRILGASRSWLAQITRHRMGSFTSSSQHYQEYDGYPNILHSYMVNDKRVRDVLRSIDICYKDLIYNDVPKEEARQILPNAKAVNLMWTVNARSLHNFMRLRMCLRNVTEMRVFCNKILSLVEQWWPEFAEILGPPCYTDGKCNQGNMTCGGKYEKNKNI